PESPISYHPSTVPSMSQHALNMPLWVSCAIDRNTLTMIKKLQEMDKFIEEADECIEELTNMYAAIASNMHLSGVSTSPVEHGCRGLPRGLAAGTPVVEPLHRYRPSLDT